MPLTISACAGASVFASCAAWGCVRMTEQTILAGLHPACPSRATAVSECVCVCVCEPCRRHREGESLSTGTPGDAADVMSQGGEHGYEMRTARDREPVTLGFL